MKNYKEKRIQQFEEEIIPNLTLLCVELEGITKPIRAFLSTTIDSAIAEGRRMERERMNQAAEQAIQEMFPNQPK